MPTGRPQTATMRKKIRPSSAGPNLQSHPCYTTSLFDNNRPSTASSSSLRTQDKGALPTRPVTQSGARRQWRAPQEDVRMQEIQKQPRRLTLGAVDGLQPDLIKNRPRSGGGFVSDQLKNKGRIEEQIDLNTLEELKKAFLRADRDESGQLDLEEFKALLKSRLNLRVTKEAQIEALFKKIDWSYNGGITWDEFCTYMQLEYAEKEDSYLRSKEVEFLLPAKIASPPHRDPILRITSNVDGSFLACSQDGTVTFWGLANNELKWKRKKEIVNTETMSRTKPKWITDFVIMADYNKFIVGTGDREIQFFELSSYDPYCQISSLETVPLQLDYCSTGTDECIIVYGDSQGCINILVIKNPGESLRLWKKEKRHGGFIPSISLDKVIEIHKAEFIRWQVHKDWVQQLKYYHDIKMIISCSNDRDTALVKGCTLGSAHLGKDSKESQDKAKVKQMLTVPKTRQSSDQSVFQIYKGVKCFDFCKDRNVIVTGGMDRIVRLWNPYVNAKPTAMLRGHNAPIFYLLIAKEENRIFSISTDRCIKIWDIQDHNCLMTVREKGHAIRGDIQACHYSTISKTLAIATDNMCLLLLRQKSDQDAKNVSSLDTSFGPTLHRDITVTHKEPVTCCKYNACFNYVITCSESSVIKIWDFETGTAIFEYGEAHGDSAITCMTFDNTERRLITGGRDGVLNIWNYNNGHCLRKLMKPKKNDEICDVVYVEMNKNRYIISVGWDKRINIYSDSQTESNIHHVQHPNIVWADDVKNGHKEDILTVAQCQPNLLATAGYDGEIVVWNMVSGHIFCKLHGKSCVSKLLFMSERAYNKEAASLISNGPEGHILFWKVFEGGSLEADFPGTSTEGALISTMTINEANTMLYAADNLGFIFIYNVDGYALSQKEEEPPELVNTWRGHVDSIVCIELVEKNKVIMSASMDCTVRLWNYEGNYIGTFGQPEQWDLYNTATFFHPMVPYDVLIDPMSLPSHPVLKDTSKTEDDMFEEIKKKEDESSKIQPTYTTYVKPTIHIDDDTIARDIKDLNDVLKDHGVGDDEAKKYHGKWLRHEKTKIKKVDKGGPSDYQTLKWSPIMEPPQPEFPKQKFNRDDPFGSGMESEMITNSIKSFSNKQQAVS